jgi:hypothetical protein
VPKYISSYGRIHRDVTHKYSNFSEIDPALFVVCTAVIGGGENRTLDTGSGEARRILRNEEFDCMCIGKVGEIMVGKMDSSVDLYGREGQDEKSR